MDAELAPSRRWQVASVRPAVSPTCLGALAMLGATALWGTSLAATKSALVTFPPFTLACLRFALGALLLLAILSLRQRRPVLSWRAAALGMFGVALFFLGQNAGLQRARAGDATIILGGGLSIIAALLGVVWLGEAMNRNQWVGLGCSVFGVVAVACQASEGVHDFAWVGVAWLVVAAISGAIYTVLGRHAYQQHDLLPLLGGSVLFGTLFLALPAITEIPLLAKSVVTLPALGWVLYLGMGCSALGFVLWAIAFRHLTAVQNAIVANLELPFGLLAATLMLGEPVSAWQVIGGALVILGALLSVSDWR